MPRQPDAVMTIDELADYLKISKSTLYHLVRRGEVSGTKIGRHWRFHRLVIDRWLGEAAATSRKAMDDPFSDRLNDASQTTI